MADTRISHTATLLPNGKVLLAGGQSNSAGTVASSCNLYNPTTNNFDPCGGGGAMQMERAAHSATLLDNGHVLVAGGYRSGNAGFAVTTELYDYTTDAWSAGPALHVERAWHTATAMGNQKVLITGGMNNSNLLEAHGFLDSTEIYDPNSNTVTVGPAMHERKESDTALLMGDGKVALYGGLGNITTSYYTTGLNFDTGSSLVLAPANGNTWTDATITAGASTLKITPDITLSQAMNGVISEGTVNFSTPTAQTTDMHAYFTYPDGTEASLAGVSTANSGELHSQISIATHSGTAYFTPQKESPVDTVLSPGSKLTASGVGGGATIVAGTTYNLDPTNSVLVASITIPMPSSDVGATILRGRVILTAGSISVNSNDTVAGYDAKITSGIATIDGAVVINDATNGAEIVVNNLQFTGVAGTVANSTTPNENNPILPAGAPLVSLAAQVFYIASPISMEGDALTFDVATVTIRTASFADEEDYTPSANSWAFGTAIAPRLGHAAVLMPNGDEAIFGGGYCTAVNTCSVTNGPVLAHILTQTGAWTQGSTLNDARSHFTLTLLPSGKALAAGGTGRSDVLSSAELYDPSTQAWTRTGSLKQQRSHHTATLLADGTVLAAGGFTTLSQSTGTTSSAEIYYPASGAWVPTGSMISSRAYHASVLLPNGNVLAIGGFTNGKYLDSTEVYISTAHRWISGPKLLNARAQFTASLLQDGRVLVVGGVNASNGVLNSSEYFDPQANPWPANWTAGPNLNFQRFSQTATMLRDGRVLVVGGDGGTGEVGHSEIFDPKTNQFNRVKEDLNGNDIGVPRFGHTSVLLPDGRVLVIGGFTASGQAVSTVEGFDVAFSTWQNQGTLPTSHQSGDGQTIVLANGDLLNVGGVSSDNSQDVVGYSDTIYYGDSPDAATFSGGQARKPSITSVQPTSRFLPGGLVTAVGDNFKNRTEASGGGAGAPNSSQSSPRVYLQRIDGGGGTSDESGWLVDLTSAAYDSGLNSWANMNASVSFTVPYTSATMPLGWYHLRVAANSQFSDSALVQVAPAVPTGIPGVPSGVALGPSSVAWTWSAAPGSFDGYSVYSATSGVFLATVAPSGSATESFLQSNLGPDTSAFIKVAAYNIGGDGTVSVATVPVVTAVSLIKGLQGTAQNESTVFWSWNPVDGALSYDVYSATSGIKLGNSAANNFSESNLSTNTQASVRVQAVMPGGLGVLTPSVTVYTDAAPPLADFPPLQNVSTGGFIAAWTANTNPGGTQYHVDFTTDRTTNTLSISPITGLTFDFANATIYFTQGQVIVGTQTVQNVIFNVSVAAINGDGVLSSFASLGSTCTLALPPTALTITNIGPSTLSFDWSDNGNNSSTTYQVLLSSDNFATAISTVIPFTQGYTGNSATVNNLLTDVNYSIRVSARNSYGAETAYASTQAVTTNGGGPAGSLVFTAGATSYTTVDGTLGSGRRFKMSVNGGTFDADTRIFIATRALADMHCGGINAGVTITDLSGAQPKLPIDIAIEYIPGESNLGALATLGITRFDPVSGVCVPLESSVDEANHLVHARINHFSDYQLTQLTPQSQGSLGIGRIFPDPFYASRTGYVTFDRLPSGARVRIFTLLGDEVFDETTNASGVLTWTGRNRVGRAVASGVYLVVVESGGTKRIMKMAVVR
ncbi:MAG: fibronectin type III domain-containing protein [Elusimicrobia bacterium]|nr:fibronectin type III domain-containing protein [Elusimicrobiota bacterium]